LEEILPTYFFFLRLETTPSRGGYLYEKPTCSRYFFLDSLGLLKREKNNCDFIFRREYIDLFQARPKLMGG